MEIKSLSVSFEGTPRPNLVFQADVSRYPVSKLRDAILKKYSVVQDPSPNEWNFYINSIMVSPFEATIKNLRNLLGDISCGILLELYSKKEPQQEGRVYNFCAKLRKTLKENEKLFLTDIETNGMIDQQILNVMGRLKGLLTELELPLAMSRIHLNMDFLNQNSPVFMLENPVRNKLTITPYMTHHHAALLIIFPNGRRIHVDASGSISRNNFLLMQKGCDSYTYINYQYDDTEDKIGFAGGNCSIYMLLNMVRVIIHSNDYREKRFTFEEFWLRFERVFALTIDTDKQKIIERLYYSLLYMKATEKGTLKGDYGQSISYIRQEFPIPDGIFLSKSDIERMDVDTMDFTADCIMLDLLIVADKGFHQITQLGNYLREMLKEITSHGFINMYYQSLGKPCLCD